MEEDPESIEVTKEEKTIFDQIEKLQHERHDLVHKCVSSYLKIPFGELKVEDLLDKMTPLMKETMINSTDWPLVKRQTPDIFLINNEDQKCYIIDVAISNEQLAVKVKTSKYDLLRRLIIKCNYSCRIIPIIYDPISGNFTGDDELKIHKGIISNVVKEIDGLTNQIKDLLSTEAGRKWRIISMESLKLKEPLVYTKENLLGDISQHPNLPFNNEIDLHNILEGKLEIVDTDIFLDYCLSKEESVKYKLTERVQADIKKFWLFHKYNAITKFKEDIKSGKEEYAKLMLEQNIKFRSYLPLPNLDGFQLEFSDRRIVENDEEEIKILLSYCKESTDLYVNLLGKKSQKITEESAKKYFIKDNYECYRTVRISKEDLFHISLEGPNRRRFVKVSKEHQAMSNKNTNYWVDPDLDVEEIKTLSYRYSRIDNPQDEPDKWRGPGLDYLRACQEIYREININAIRKVTNKTHILKPTKIKGLYIAIFKGPQLRNAETSTTVWFKILMIPEKTSLSQENIVINTHWKKWFPNAKIWTSRWLSVDSNRLDHYLRCYDRVIMSYLSYINTNEQSMKEAILQDTSNTLGMIILIYLEDKRSTSKMLQDVRYLFMNKLSVYDYSGKTLERFETPIRTPLQLYLLKKIVSYFAVSKFRDIVSNLLVGHYDYSPGTLKLNDKFSGLFMKIKRILTDGPDINFDQILHEMYFCMLFNKNQDDPTHASFQILTKILEGENNYHEIKLTTKLHNGYNNSWKQDIDTLLQNDKRNQFSRMAICIGSKLQSTSKFSGTYQSGSAHEFASRSSIINKTVDKFATFKSSSMLDREVYNHNISEMNTRPKIEQKQKESREYWESNDLYVNDDDIKEEDDYVIGARTTKQNRRRRCVLGCIELINSDCYTAFQVAKKTLKNTESFQVFKKNQIGGVREILILDISDRITINILESFSRIICSKDSREMLTHGPIKNKVFHELIRRVRLHETKSKMFHLNFDKSKWGPSFQPIQFIYMFYPYKDMYPDLFRLLLSILIKHSNKQVILPERLIRAWIKDPDNVFRHEQDKNLQRLKESFLLSKSLIFKNESNMGQGILHFTSSLLHLCLISFRDSLYKKWLIKHEIKCSVYWEDILSSDDSYTAINTGTNDPEMAKFILDGFLKMQELSERLFNCETSRSKSSVSNIVCEFNSLFGTNLGFHPTRIKFALASMDVFYTDSYYRMVKESFNSCRSLFENGASLELYTIAHKLNKIFCDHIYATNESLTNPSIILDSTKIPYQLGCYPLNNPIMMLIFGPESHNYELLSSWDTLNDSEKTIFLNSHSSTHKMDINSLSNPIYHDDLYGGIYRIQTRIRPSRLISALRRLSPFKPEQIREFIGNDPLFLIRSAENNDEIKMKISMMLFLENAAEAARSVNPAFFYGRMSAIKRARIFYIPTIHDKLQTYSSALLWFKERETTISRNDLDYLYPHIRRFQKIKKFIDTDTDEQTARNLLEVKRLTMLTIKESEFKLNNNMSDILFNLWIRQKGDNSLERDCVTLMEFYPFIKPSLQDTLKNLSEDKQAAVQKLSLLLMRMMGKSEKPLKIINYGDSSQDIDGTVLSIMLNNKYEDRSSRYNLLSDLSVEGLSKFEEIKLISNISYLFMLECEDNNVKNPDFLSHIDDTTIYAFMKNTAISDLHKKTIFFLLLTSKRASSLIELTNSVNYTISEYLVEQSQDLKGNYFGEGIVKVQQGYDIVIIDSISKSFKVNRINSTTTIKLMLEGCRLLGKRSQFFERVDGNFKLDVNKLNESKEGGLMINIAEIAPVRILPGQITKLTRGFKLTDRLTKKTIMTIKNPFIFTNSVFLPKAINFEYKGINVRYLVKNRFFSTNFHMDDMDRNQSIDAINFKYLKENPVEEPEVTEHTIRNLGIEVEDEETETRVDNDSLSELLLDPEMLRQMNEIIKENEVKISTQEMELSNIAQEGDEPPEPPDEDLSELQKTIDYYNMDTNDFFQMDLESKQMKFDVGREVKISDLLYNRITHCREIMIVHCLFNSNGIFSMSLSDLMMRFSRSPYLPSLKNSFIYVYNDLFGSMDSTHEPENIMIIVTKKFLDKVDANQKMKVTLKRRQ